MNATIAWPRLLGFFLIPLALAACGGGGGGGGGDQQKGVINPADGNRVAEALAVKFGGETASRSEGDAPAPTDDPGSPSLRSSAQNVPVAPGETKELTVTTETDGNAVVAFLYAKVTGSNSVFTVEGGTEARSAHLRKAETNTTIALDIPTNLGAGQFCVRFSVQDDVGRVSEAEEICFSFTPADNDPDIVVNRLQGAWQTECVDAEIERLVFDGTSLRFEREGYQGTAGAADCSGSPVVTEFEEGNFQIGSALTTEGGLAANSFDLEVTDSGCSGCDTPTPVGAQRLQIVRVDAQAETLVFGDDVEGSTQRPTALSDGPGELFRRQADAPVPLSEQLWQLQIMASFNGASGTATQTVTGEQVPLQEPSAEELETALQSNTQTVGDCSEYVGPITVESVDYQQNGDGAVGSVYTLNFRFTVDGECADDNRDVSGTVEQMNTYTRQE
ncbi:hypothetical protein [Algiphilus sp.]|uniref:hypothetical protein n=1 Tax=Algiphilus sp. TaxID=1872431 RepID=UPI0032EEA6E3